MNLIVTTVEQGLIYGILALGVYITYKILDFPDLTVDGRINGKSLHQPLEQIGRAHV